MENKSYCECQIGYDSCFYLSGNSWGVDEYGAGCVGCGPQEQFYGCADIAIGNSTEYDPDYYAWPWPSPARSSSVCIHLWYIMMSLWSLVSFYN